MAIGITTKNVVRTLDGKRFRKTVVRRLLRGLGLETTYLSFNIEKTALTGEAVAGNGMAYYFDIAKSSGSCELQTWTPKSNETIYD